MVGSMTTRRECDLLTLRFVQWCSSWLPCSSCTSISGWVQMCTRLTNQEIRVWTTVLRCSCIGPPQNLKIKQQIFADLERACRKDAILSTNTSTINIELVGAKTQVSH